jgi:hypothetical protein
MVSVLHTDLELRTLIMRYVGFIDKSGVYFYGCFFPTDRASSTVMALVLQIMN